VTRLYTISRAQGLVLGFFVLAWTALVVMPAVSPAARDVVVGRPDAGERRPMVASFLAGLWAS